MTAAAPVLLYDASCGFCSGIVQRILRHDRRGTLQFAPLDGQFAAVLRARYPALEGTDSVVWFAPAHADIPERVLLRSDAALAVARYLGGPWTIALLGYALPRPLRDALYRLIARHRHRLMAPVTDCLLPSAAIRARFLD